MTVVTAAGLGLVSLGAPAAPADPTRRASAELKSLADAAGVALEGAPAEEIARWATSTFGDRFCVTSSMADATRNGSMPISTSRVMAPGASLVCSVEKTK